MQAGWDQPPAAASRKCSQHLQESRGKPQASHRPRTGKPQRPKRWEPVGNSGLSQEGSCPNLSGSGNGLQTALNSELSKLMGEGSLPGQGPTSVETARRGIKAEQDWCFRQRAGPQKQVKLQLQTCMLMTHCATCLGHWDGCRSGVIASLTCLDTMLWLNPCHSSLFQTWIYISDMDLYIPLSFRPSISSFFKSFFWNVASRILSPGPLPLGLLQFNL